MFILSYKNEILFLVDEISEPILCFLKAEIKNIYTYAGHYFIQQLANHNSNVMSILYGCSLYKNASGHMNKPNVK